MKKHIIEPGEQYGYLTVIGDSESKRMPSGRMERMIKCKCECGKVLDVYLGNLKRRPKISCGCHKENKGSNFYKHGLSKHSLYIRWNNMMSRCYNPNEAAFKDYGGRGIQVCDEWKNNRIEFYNWAIDNGYSRELELDRRENNQGYSPENCRWVTKSVNCNNRRSTIMVMYNGEKMGLAQLARLVNIKRATLYQRIIGYNKTIEEAILPVKKFKYECNIKCDSSCEPS